MQKRIPVALITNPEGAHLGAYLEALAKIEEVESVALVDATGGTVAQAKKALGDKLTATFDNSRALLQSKTPVMTLVTLEAALAPPVIAAALQAGSHVLAEKPACIRAEDFEALVSTAEGKHLNLMLAFANRLNGPVREARRLVQAGLFGKIFGVEMHIVADQTRLKRSEYHKTWFADKLRAGGGHLVWLGIHWLDLVRHITGMMVREVCGLTAIVGGQPITAEDSAALVLRFENGSLGTLTSGYYLDKGYHMHIKIWAEHGWLELSGMADGALTYVSTKNGRDSTPERFEPVREETGYTPFVRAAVRASAGLAEPPVSSRECLDVLKTIFACYRAAETGQRQSVS